MAEEPAQFNGTQPLQLWIDDMTAFMNETGVEEAQQAAFAMTHTSNDVRHCITNVRTVLVAIMGQEWVWTWPNLRVALLGIAQQIRHYTALAEAEARKRALLITMGAIAIGLLAPIAVVGVLGAVGFGAGGVAAGSLAAAIQSSIGAVEAGSLFALCQSIGAGGAAFAAVVETSFLAATAAGVAGNIVNAIHAQLGDGSPSRTWNDGPNFIPSPELIHILLATVNQNADM